MGPVIGLFIAVSGLAIGWALGGGHCLRMSQRFEAGGDTCNFLDTVCLRVFAFFAPD